MTIEFINLMIEFANRWITFDNKIIEVEDNTIEFDSCESYFFNIIVGIPLDWIILSSGSVNEAHQTFPVLH
jgi:hypothetical protein